ncbi:hypothetical protein NQ314_019761 [Rhamnusium bicolor]|uniref:Chitin-binding type-2 domain-containing protein n=1 Tax=Rhamnusium bicolor TaxID=1586634 RepID=A0AAV8WN97_9CUCU|nr:hypothetical protein NQ314_019761 [Rhamnusium bicolor]
MYKCLVFILIAGVSAQFKCPQRTGFFPDLQECDLYYVCSQGEYEEKLCPDGLVFDDKDPNHERCDIPANIDCGDRTALQEPKPSKGCPRANGYYRHPNPTACDKFYNCVDANARTVINPKKDKLDDGFECPDGETEGPNGRKLPHPTFAHPDDCQKFYICRNGVMPQKGSCSGGSVYNEETFTCDDPANRGLLQKGQEKLNPY